MNKNRELILSLVSSSVEHPTAEQVFLQAKQASSGIVMATVYNNLNRLVEDGELRRIHVSDGPDRYDKKLRHDHLCCAECGAIADVFLPDLSELLCRESGEALLSYELTLHYLCPHCRTGRGEAN